MPDLYPLQEVGVEWIMPRRRAFLADKPGIMGKTPQWITAGVRLGLKRPLIVCPAIATEMWRRQIQTWAAGTGFAMHDRIFSYDKFRMKSKMELQQEAERCDVFIADESHFGKNPDSQRARATWFVANRASRVWPGTGTPITNHVGDLYPMLRSVWPDKLKALGITTYAQYLDYFAVTIPTRYGIKVVRNKNASVLRALMDDIMLRRTENPDLPPLRWEQFFLPKTALPVEVDAEDGEQPPTARAKRLLGEMKAPFVVQMAADELVSGAVNKLVIGAWHRDVMRSLYVGIGEAVYHEGRDVLQIHGDMTRGQKQAALDRFQQDPTVCCLILQKATVGTAVDLFAAHEVIDAEPSWSPDDDEQFVKRVHRNGQQHPVRVRSIYASCSLDEAVARTQAGKIRRRGEVLTD